MKIRTCRGNHKSLAKQDYAEVVIVQKACCTFSGSKIEEPLYQNGTGVFNHQPQPHPRREEKLGIMPPGKNVVLRSQTLHLVVK